MELPEITEIQESLKREYSEIEYNRIIKKIRSESGGDMEMLAYKAYDGMLDLPSRLFALAAMR